MSWQQAIVDALRAGRVDAVAYVPDARLRGIAAALADGGPPLHGLTREEECVAFAAAFQAAGGRAAVLMQNSGLGNALNALGSFAIPYGLGIPMVVSMRGTLGEANSSQVPMGRATPALLDALGIQGVVVSDPAAAGAAMAGALTLAFEGRCCTAVILDPVLGGQRERA